MVCLADPGRARRRALAACRPLPMGVRGVQSRRLDPDDERELRAMDYRKLSARPRHHAQAAGAIEDFKKVSHRERGKGVDPGAIEIWFADEARIGQKNKITRPWAKRGTRPSAPSDQRTASTYIFGAICPKEGKAVGLILPWCNTEAMNLHLAEIAAQIAPGAHAALL